MGIDLGILTGFATYILIMRSFLLVAGVKMPDIGGRV